MKTCVVPKIGGPHVLARSVAESKSRQPYKVRDKSIPPTLISFQIV